MYARWRPCAHTATLQQAMLAELSDHVCYKCLTDAGITHLGDKAAVLIYLAKSA